MNSEQQQSLPAGNDASRTEKRSLTIQDVCQREQVSRVTVWRWLNERGLKAMRVGRVVRISEEELERWKQKHSTGAIEAGR